MLGNRATPSAGGNLRIRMEPVDGSYTNNLVDLRSLTLRSDGAGFVNEIHSVEPKNVLEADTDHNGIPEIAACFSQADLAALFDVRNGRNAVSAQLSGSLTDGRVFCTAVAFDIMGTASAQRVSFAPNPLNPSSKLAFTTSREGPAKASLFDLHGRLVRTLVDIARLPVGEHEFWFDGKSDRGALLPSSVYFYRVECTEGSFKGQVVILE